MKNILLFMIMFLFFFMNLLSANEYDIDNDNRSKYITERVIDRQDNNRNAKAVGSYDMINFPEQEHYLFLMAGILPQFLADVAEPGGTLHFGYGYTAKYVGFEIFALGEYQSLPDINDDFYAVTVSTLLILKVPIKIRYNVKLTPYLGFGPAIRFFSIGVPKYEIGFLPSIYSKAGLRVEYNNYFFGINVSALPIFLITHPILSVNLEVGFKL